jgi:putative membrane protein
MRLFAIIPAAAAVLIGGIAAAQMGNPAAVAPGTPQAAPGTPAPQETNNTDRLFARLAATGGKAEVDLGQLAAQKATATSVKQFAQMMVEDHTKANAKLAELAKAASIALPAGLDPDHQAAREKLENLTGAAFDAAYILAEIEDHQKTVQLLQWEIGSGQDASLQKFAAETLPTVLRHLRHAELVAAERTGLTPREIETRTTAMSGERPGAARP